ncbi:MAG: nucleotide sugar dehydrogenase [Acidobacteria bacterium]|nr:nucleotide sugar dehydrogenase [Acidobacteriota bacterium]
MNEGLELKKKINAKKAVVGIIGLGYVGLPLAIALHEKKFKILGFDIDKEKVKLLKEGKGYIKHLDRELFEKMLKSKDFEATADFKRLNEPDIILVCVPTPLTIQREPDMSYIVSTTEAIKNQLRKGQLVILESTTYPGTTDELMKNMLEEKGLKEGKDFFLAFSPEREDPGRKDFTTTTTPKVVGGVSKISGELATLFYSKFIEKVIPVKDSRTAEATKLTENIFRAVNIALVNELKMAYERMGIDIWEVLDAASTKPFGFMRFNPGPGWGGHCIPLDPFYLSWKAREFGFSTKFIELAGEINWKMPEYVVEKVASGLNEQKKSIKDSKILILGIAYKKDIDDARETPAFEIIDKLLELGAKVDFYDPYVPVCPKTRKHKNMAGKKSIKLSARNLEKYDAVIVVTDHSNVDYEKIGRAVPLIIDTRGVYRKIRSNARIVCA